MYFGRKQWFSMIVGKIKMFGRIGYYNQDVYWTEVDILNVFLQQFYQIASRYF